MLFDSLYLLDVIEKFRAKEIGFIEYSQRFCGTSFGYRFYYDRDWDEDIEAWMETIEYLYPKEEWYELGCSFGDFMEDVIKNEPDPLRLPENDRVIKRHFSFILEEYKAEDAARAASPKPDDQPPKPKLYGYDNLLYAIERFRAKELLFEEYMTNMTCLYNDVGYRLDYQGNWYADMVMWFELIDYCYPREERHQLGCLVGDFIEHAIWHAPRPLSLPKDNPVIRDYFDQSSPAETTETG